MKVKVLKFQPTKVVVKDLTTGKKIKYPKQFFLKRYEMGVFQVKNPERIPIAV